MPSINMIAPRRAEKRRRERDMRRLLLVIVAELIVAVGAGGWICTRLFTTNNRIAELDTQIAKLRPVVRQITAYRKAVKQLEPRMKLLSQSKERTLRWYSALDKLTQSLPSSTYLTKINTVPDAQNPLIAKINLNGISISQERVGEAMMRLNEVREFDSVDLHYTQHTTVGSASAVEFEIGTVMKNGPQGKGADSNARAES